MCGEFHKVLFFFLAPCHYVLGFPGGSVVKNLLANAGDIGDSVSIPGLGRSPGGGNGNSLQHSCPGNPRDRGTWWDTVHGLAKVSDVTEHARMHYVLKLHLTSYITLLLIVLPLNIITHTFG